MIYVKTVGGKYYKIDDYNPSDNVKIFKQKVENKLLLLNNNLYKNYNKKITYLLFLIKNRYDGKNLNNHFIFQVFDTFINIRLIWNIVSMYLFPYHEKLVKYNPLKQKIRIIFCGKLLKDEDTCENFYKETIVHVVFPYKRLPCESTNFNDYPSYKTKLRVKS